MASSSSQAESTAIQQYGDTTTTTIDIAANVQLVRDNIQKASSAAASSTSGPPVRLVAVSKTKPIELLRRAYDEANVRVFGENYVQELVEKVPQLPNDVQWHFIGTLQSNKVGALLSPFLKQSASSNIHRLVLETVSTMKLARKLNKAIVDCYQAQQESQEQTQQEREDQRLKIFVQVNTSGEESKGGVTPAEAISLCRDICTECPALHLMGLMTIGAPGDESCLDALVDCRTQVQEAIIAAADDFAQALPLELSMGMSGDYEVAIHKGSTNVRVGSTIFGARDYSNINKNNNNQQ